MNKFIYHLVKDVSTYMIFRSLHYLYFIYRLQQQHAIVFMKYYFSSNNKCTQNIEVLV